VGPHIWRTTRSWVVAYVELRPSVPTAGGEGTARVGARRGREEGRAQPGTARAEARRVVDGSGNESVSQSRSASCLRRRSRQERTTAAVKLGTSPELQGALRHPYLPASQAALLVLRRLAGEPPGTGVRVVLTRVHFFVRSLGIISRLRRIGIAWHHISRVIIHLLVLSLFVMSSPAVLAGGPRRLLGRGCERRAWPAPWRHVLRQFVH
jgi:hypothetical protein